MHHATLLVVNGPTAGTRFDIHTDTLPLTIGRSVGNQIRVDDTEVSRRHLQIEHDGNAFRATDLGSANSTYLNGNRIQTSELTTGDMIRMGAVLLSFEIVGERPPRPSDDVQIIDDAADPQHSAIVQQVQAEAESGSAVWPLQKVGLELFYQVSEELVRPAQRLEALLQRILQATLVAVGADRGCILLRDRTGDELSPIVFGRREERDGQAEGPREPMCISRTITGHVLRHGQAVRTSDAKADTRFDGHSIVSSGIREAICAPMRGQEGLLGVIYLDITSEDTLPGQAQPESRLTDEHLKSVLAVARQTALAVEARQFQRAMVKAERFAAMGQTIAVLSHHIKNILQGVRGGGYLIEMGLNQPNPDLVRQGWGIVERNQNRISDLVMDMLSFSKERVPKLEAGQVNETCREVAELAELSAKENGVQFEFRPQENLPMAEFDLEGIHRAVLNIVKIGIDAVAESEDGRVILETYYDREHDVMIVAVTDNGPGIPEEQRASVFQAFESSKGERGTGIGLPVSRKILREHGGRIDIEGEHGEGTRFVLSWPRGNPKTETVRLESQTQVPDGPNYP